MQYSNLLNIFYSIAREIERLGELAVTVEPYTRNFKIDLFAHFRTEHSQGWYPTSAENWELLGSSQWLEIES